MIRTGIDHDAVTLMRGIETLMMNRPVPGISDDPIPDMRDFMIEVRFHIKAIDETNAVIAMHNLVDSCLSMANDPNEPGYVEVIEMERAAELPEEDDDPRCVCGVYRSEHAMMGCPEGFQTAKQWDDERSAIHRFAEMEACGEIEPGWEWWGNQ